MEGRLPPHEIMFWVFLGSYRMYGSRIWNPLKIWWKGTRPQNICQDEPHRRPLAK